MYRKIYVAFFTSVIAILSLATFEQFSGEWDEDIFTFILAFSIYVVPIMFTYGIIMSMIADKIASKYTYFHAVSFGLHILFGLCFFFLFILIEPIIIENGFFNYVTINSFVWSAIFFIIDYLFKTIEKYSTNNHAS